MAGDIERLAQPTERAGILRRLGIDRGQLGFVLSAVGGRMEAQRPAERE
ncbi:hypothetical protein [Streptomyces violaceus]